MNILYITTSPPPKFQGADAVVQDVQALKKSLGGEDLCIYPLKNPSRWVLPEIMGIDQLHKWSNIKHRADLIHVFQPTLRPIPFLETMGKPIVYTVLTTLKNKTKPATLHLWNPSKRAVGYLDESDGQRLKEWGIENSLFIPPGIDLEHFTPPQDSRAKEFTLLVGSAPWTLEQFHSKGIDTLLDAAVRHPTLRLIFLWRGLHLEALEARIRERNLEPRTEIINERVNVSDVLARTHATVVLAEHERLVKAYPHSLIESLCAGRPVIISGCMAMAKQVEKQFFGSVVTQLDEASFDGALRTLQNSYEEIEQNVRQSAKEHYSIQNMVDAYSSLYSSVLSTPA